MSMVDKNGKLWGKINVIDFTLAVVVVVGVLGVFLVQSGTEVTSGKVVEGESDILTTIQIPNLKTLDKNLFEVGKKTAITIRNQPRGEVLIQNVVSAPVRITVSSGKAVPDMAQNNSYDYTIVLKDHAKITADGYVAEGVKVKIGLPIELEGFKYRVYGKIVDVEKAQ